jgi:hypothetical protein
MQVCRAAVDVSPQEHFASKHPQPPCKLAVRYWLCFSPRCVEGVVRLRMMAEGCKACHALRHIVAVTAALMSFFVVFVLLKFVWHLAAQ